MRRKMLVAYSMLSSYVQATRDYIEAAKLYSDFDVSYLHVVQGAEVDQDVLDQFDIVFHSYCARLIFDGYVSEIYVEALKRFRGLKVLAVQDEYNDTNKLKAAIKNIGFQIVLTCVPQSDINKVYPKLEFPNVDFRTIFTGYVPDNFASFKLLSLPISERPIGLGYRGRDIGPLYGRLGRDKYEIGIKMREICNASRVNCDIAMDEKSRIYGKAWFEFIGSCRAMLGTESGSNIFDFDGSIRRRYNEQVCELGRPPTHDEFYPFIRSIDGEFNMGQISPRVFECAVMRTPMVLLRGRYSDAIEAGVHYIPLEKDYSNANKVLAQLSDYDSLAAMAERAYDHLVASQKFGYRSFWQELNEVFEAGFLSIEPRKLICVDNKSSFGSQHAEIMSSLRKTPMHESPTYHVKGLEDYERQKRDSDKLEKVLFFSAGFRNLSAITPRKWKFILAKKLKFVLDQKEAGQKLTPRGKLAFVIWSLAPRSIKAMISARLSMIEYMRIDR